MKKSFNIVAKLILIVLVLSLQNIKVINAKDVGNSLDDLTEFEVIKVSDISQSLNGNYNLDSLVFRYEAHPTDSNFQLNGGPISNGTPVATDAFAKRGGIRLFKGDIITYTNKFNQTVRIEAQSEVKDFIVVANENPKEVFHIGTQTIFDSSADLKITIDGEDKPSYAAFIDLDYSDSVAVNKKDIDKIVVKDNTEITYTDDGKYITFHGRQGRERSGNDTEEVWVTILLKTTEAEFRFRSGYYTLTAFTSTKLFPEVQQQQTPEPTVVSTLKPILVTSNQSQEVKPKWTCADEGKVWNEEKQMCEGQQSYSYKVPNTAVDINSIKDVTILIISFMGVIILNKKR